MSGLLLSHPSYNYDYRGGTRMKIKYLLTMSLIVIFFSVTSPAYAANSDQNATWSVLTDISNKIYLYTKDDQLKEARSMIDLFATKWQQAVPKTIQISNTNLRVVHSTYDQLDEAFKERSFDHNSLVDSATEFRLVINALSTQNKPLWKNMDGEVLGQFSKMEAAAASGDNDNFQTQLNIFLGDYKLIYPALVVDLNPHTLAKIDGDVQQITKERLNIVHNQVNLNKLKQVDFEFKSLFGHTAKQMSPNILFPALAIASLIFLTLIYVSWKKYNGEARIQSYKFFS